MKVTLQIASASLALCVTVLLVMRALTHADPSWGGESTWPMSIGFGALYMAVISGAILLIVGTLAIFKHKTLPSS